VRRFRFLKEHSARLLRVTDGASSHWNNDDRSQIASKQRSGARALSHALAAAWRGNLPARGRVGTPRRGEAGNRAPSDSPSVGPGTYAQPEIQEWPPLAPWRLRGEE
jgi:hypothetical protein